MPQTTKTTMKTLQPDTSARILAIRAKAGNLNTRCPICGHKPASPYRLYRQDGKIIHGCIDAIHTGHLVPISESSRWHNRHEAIQMRRDELKQLKS